jgi:hypothetical protein
MEATHKFELAGLGKAPFRIVGAYVSKFQAVPGDPNCPIQPGTSCDYCGQGIMNVVRVRGADGKEFKVGYDCAGKVGDAGLKKALAPHLTKLKNTLADDRIAATRTALADEATRAKLAALPHPKGFESKTLLDWCEWMLRHSGRAGSIRVCREVEKLLKSATA